MATTYAPADLDALLAEEDLIEALERAAERRRVFIAIWHACAA